MKEGEDVSFWLDGSVKHGKILKIYTKIGFENHGEEFVVILLYNSNLRFYEGEVSILKKDIGAPDRDRTDE